MRFALIAALKDIKRRLADPVALLTWIGVPVVLGGLMGLIGGDSAPAPKARLLLVDLDQTLVSGLVARAGGQGQLAEFLEIQPVAADEGQRRIDAGDASALLVIPKGFQEGVLREQPTVLTLVTNPSQRILPAILQEGLQIVIEAAFYGQRLFGEPIRQIVDGMPAGATGPPDDLVASVSRSINQRLRTLQDTLVPPVFTIEAKAEAASADQPSFGALFLPGLLFMALLFAAQSMSSDIWIEKLGGTLRRTLSAPQGAAAFLGGKIIAGVTVMALATLFALVLGVVVFKVPVARAVLALLWSAFAGAAMLCYLIAIQLAASSARGGQLLSTIVVFPLIMIGGSFFPFEAMPAWMADIGRWTPNGLAVVQVKQILFGTPEAQGLFIAAAVISVPAVVVFFLSVRRLTGAFATN